MFQIYKILRMLCMRWFLFCFYKIHCKSNNNVCCIYSCILFIFSIFLDPQLLLKGSYKSRSVCKFIVGRKWYSRIFAKIWIHMVKISKKQYFSRYCCIPSLLFLCIFCTGKQSYRQIKALNWRKCIIIPKILVFQQLGLMLQSSNSLGFLYNDVD